MRSISKSYGYQSLSELDDSEESKGKKVNNTKACFKSCYEKEGCSNIDHPDYSENNESELNSDGDILEFLTGWKAMKFKTDEQYSLQNLKTLKEIFPYLQESELEAIDLHRLLHRAVEDIEQEMEQERVLLETSRQLYLNQVKSEGSRIALRFPSAPPRSPAEIKVETRRVMLLEEQVDKYAELSIMPERESFLETSIAALDSMTAFIAREVNPGYRYCRSCKAVICCPSCCALLRARIKNEEHGIYDGELCAKCEGRPEKPTAQWQATADLFHSLTDAHDFVGSTGYEYLKECKDIEEALKMRVRRYCIHCKGELVCYHCGAPNSTFQEDYSGDDISFCKMNPSYEGSGGPLTIDPPSIHAVRGQDDMEDAPQITKVGENSSVIYLQI
jgi:hypothetical protein